MRPLGRFLSRRVPIHALRIGSARLLGLPAEPSAALGDALRQASAQGQPLFVMSHANDWLGYAVSAQRYRQGGYEACMSFHGAGFGRWLVGEATQTMRLLDSRARQRPVP